MDRKTKFIFIVSVLVNIIFGAMYALEKVNAPVGSLGALKHDLRVYHGKDSREYFILPKGLTVREASPRGFTAIGQLEPFQFTIVLTCDDHNLVEYGNDMPKRRSEYYSVSH